MHFNKTLLAIQKDISNQFAALETRLSEMSRPSEISPSSFEDVVNEATERIRRANNIIIRNAPEAPTNVNSTEHDTQLLQDVVKTICPDAPIDFNPIFIRRVGKKIGNKPRTLKVTFTNELAALSILKKKKNLANTNFTQVSIQNDLTPRQMEYLNNLRQEL